MKKLLVKSLVILGLAVFFIGKTTAQNYNFKTYTVNDGLPASQVYDVEISNAGIVWFATSYGLVSFDGSEFTRYGEKSGLPGDLVYDLFTDSEGRFWVSTEAGGVAQLLPDTIIYPEALDAIKDIEILFMNQSPKTGNLWFGSMSNGLFIWDGEKIEKIDENNGLDSTRVWDIRFHSDDKIWLSTDIGIVILNEGNEAVEVAEIIDEEDGLSNSYVYETFEAADGTIWVATRNGVTLIKDGRFEILEEINGQPLNTVNSVNQDENGLIWIGTSRKGIFWFDGESYQHITKNHGLSSNYIFRFVKDRDGNIWVATEGNGVSLLRGENIYAYDRDSEFGQKSSYSLLVDENGRLWSGNEKGLTKLENGEFTLYPFPEELAAAGEIWDIEKLPNGNLILLTYNYWVLEFDGSEYSLSEYDSMLQDYYVMDFEVGKDGTLWIATYLEILKARDGNITSVKKADDSWVHVHIIFEDSKGRVWVGTERGIANLADEEQYYTVEDGIAGGEVYDITEDERGNLWVGTNEGVSVVRFYEDGQAAKVDNFKNEDVFQTETISLIHDKNGGVWQGTNSGLNYFNTQKWYATGEMDILYYSLQDHNRGMEFSGAAAELDAEGNVWFGTPESGLVKFNNSTATRPSISEPPESYIRKLYVNSEKMYDSRLHTSGEPLVFDHNKNNIEIEYGADNFKDPYRIFYRYKLEGFDNDWQLNFAKREVIYTNLEPGTYTFKLMAKSTHSNWPEHAATLTFSIDAPFWTTSWFIALIVLIFGSVTALGLKYYLNYSEKNKLKKLVDEQTNTLTKALTEKEILIKEIHHRVKNNLAVVSGLLDLQSWQMEDGEAKDALEDSKLRIRAMSSIHEKLYQNTDLTQIKIGEFVDELIHEISRSLKGAHKNINVESDIQVEYLGINQAIPCGLILNELISNSYEHAFPESKAGNIKIQFREEGENYILHVEDDGIGIPEEILNGDRSSLGLTLIQSLCQQVNGSFNFDVENGTKVNLVFPK